MDATAIVLLVGICSFWVVVGMMFALFGKAKKVLENMDQTLADMRDNMAQLTPILSETLQEVEKSGQEMGQTASEIKALTRRINSGTTASTVSGAVNYLPLAFTVFKTVRPFFEKIRNRNHG